MLAMILMCGIATTPSGQSVQSPSLEEHAVQIVDGRDGSPIEGADVYWEATRPSRDWPVELRFVIANRERHMRFEDFERRLLIEGHFARSDENGLVAAIDPETWPRILASKDGMFGMHFGFEWPFQQPIRVALFPDAPLDVIALDFDGEPLAGLSVRLVLPWGGFDSEAILATTEADGRARFPHARTRIEHQRARWKHSASKDATWRLRVADWRSDLGVEFTLDPWPDKPVELRASRGGVVEVEFVDALERAVALSEVAALCPAASVSFDVDSASWVAPDGRWDFGFPGRSGSMLSDARSGRAEFQHVPLGAELAVVVELENSELQARLFKGPVEVGERVRLRFELGRQIATTTGRLLDAEHKPLAGMLVSTSVERVFSAGETRFGLPLQLDPIWGAVLTDADGRFVDHFGTLEEDEDAARRIVFTAYFHDRSPIAARQTVPSYWKPGVRDLGDIVLVEAPIVLSGRVVDGSGAPIVDALVGSSRDSEAKISTRTDATGAFTLRSAHTHFELPIHVDVPHFDEKRLKPFVPGSRDVLIRVCPGAKLTGRIPQELVQRRLWYTIGVETNTGPRFCNANADGTFELRDLEPATYDVIVLGRGNQRWTVRPAVTLAPGAAVDVGEVLFAPN